MQNKVIIIISVSLILLLCTAFSLNASSLHKDVRNVLRSQFQGHIHFVESEPELKGGTPIGTGRQKIWLYDDQLGHHLFLRLVESEYTEYREMEENRVIPRTSKEQIHQLISQQRNDLQQRKSLLLETKQTLAREINVPFFVHFGRTDRYRHTLANQPTFTQHHPVYLNLVVPSDLDNLLATLDSHLPAIEKFLTEEPNRRVSFYSGQAQEFLAPMLNDGYWVSDAPPEDSYIGSRPLEAMWQSGSILLTAQPAVNPQPASAREAQSLQVRGEHIKKMKNFETEVNQLGKRGVALQLAGASPVVEQLRDEVETILLERGNAILPVSTGYYLDKNDEQWVLHFFNTERQLDNPVHVRYYLQTGNVETTPLQD